MAESYQSLAHSKWKCNYHVVFIPKRRRKALYGQLRKHLGTTFMIWPSKKVVGSSKGI